MQVIRTWILQIVCEFGVFSVIWQAKTVPFEVKVAIFFLLWQEKPAFVSFQDLGFGF